jgi:hypothetical protein
MQTLIQPAVGEIGSDPLALERELLAFRGFYASLSDRRDLFFMFFTSSLLHWVIKCERLVPPEIPLVLLGANLLPEERRWVEENLGRPFHHIGLAVDDRIVWEFLFQTCEHNFGWLDIDCFVLNPELFREMRSIAPGVVANHTFSLSRFGIGMPMTFFLFLSRQALESVLLTVEVSPALYAGERFQSGHDAGASFTRRLNPELIALLRKVLPAGTDGSLPFFSEPRSFDTLQVYHLVALALGYRFGRVRPLAHQEASDEIVHVGKVSYYRKISVRLDSAEKIRAYTLFLQTEYFFLEDARHLLPRQYGEHREEIGARLRELGAATGMDDIRKLLSQVLCAKGASAYALEKISNGR